jgi:hypothetical protein
MSGIKKKSRPTGVIERPKAPPSSNARRFKEQAEDAYASETRRDALRRVEERHPALFSPKQIEPGLKRYAIAPSAAMEKHLDTYWQFIDALPFSATALGDIWPDSGNAGDNSDSVLTSFLNMFRRWWSPLDQLSSVTEDLNVEAALGYDANTSLNAVSLYRASLIHEDLITLADGRRDAIIKSQRYIVDEPGYEGHLNHSLFEFNNEVVVSRLLNTLVTAWPHTVTPHFTTFLGAFQKTHLGETRVFAVYERAHETLKEALRRNLPWDMLGAILFQLMSTFAAASTTLGYAHNDAHLGNVMLRKVDGTRYANAMWAYKLRGVDRFIFIPPELHYNHMVEIIDQGRATIGEYAPNDIRSTHALRFAYDMRNMLGHLINALAERETENDPLLKLLYTRYLNIPRRTEDSPLVAPGLYNIDDTAPRHTRNGNLLAAHTLLTRWATDDPDYGFAEFFKPFIHLTGGVAKRPLVVSVAPGDTILSVRDPMTEILAGIWGVPTHTMTDVSFSKCKTCFSEAKFTTEERKFGFCGKDCYRVFYGEMDY